MKKEVLIVGGGFAGLAAGVELASLGHEVTLVERKGHLGGRAYSFRDPVTGAVMDNGQHVLMGCYRETLKFLDKIGTRDRLIFQKNLSVDFASRETKQVRFKAWPVPAPFHLLGGFLSFQGLSWQDKLSLLKIGRFFQKHRSNGHGLPESLDRISIPTWLNELGQTEQIQDRFWNPFALAALNDRPDLCSAGLFYSTLKEALFDGRDASQILLPKVGLSDLYVEAARDYIERKGGHVLTKTPVVRLKFKGHEFHEVELEGGRRVSAEALVLAVPFTALRKLLPEEMLYGDPFFLPITKLQNSPIVSIHLWLDRDVIDAPFVGLWGTRVHWVFNKGNYLSLVISGARQELMTPGPQLADMAMQELREVFPQMAGVKVVRSVVTKEPEATLAPAVGVSKLRLSQKTPYKNLFLAGDWTDTGLPATIESAVRSAQEVVRLIEEST